MMPPGTSETAHTSSSRSLSRRDVQLWWSENIGSNTARTAPLLLASYTAPPRLSDNQTSEVSMFRRLLARPILHRIVCPFVRATPISLPVYPRLAQSAFGSMPPKRKAVQAAPLPASDIANGTHSDADLTPPPHLPPHPTEPEVEHAVDVAVDNVLRKHRRTNPVSYAEPVHEEDNHDVDIAELAAEAEDVAEKLATAAAAVTPKKGKGKARTPRKTAAQKRQEEEEDDYEHEENGAHEEDGEADEEVEKPAPKGKKGRKKAAPATLSTPAKRSAKEASSSPLSDEDGKKPKKKTPRKPTPKKSRLAVDEPEYDEDGNEIIKKKRKPKVYPKIEYDIPDVERLETTFKGEYTRDRADDRSTWVRVSEYRLTRNQT